MGGLEPPPLLRRTGGQRWLSPLDLWRRRRHLVRPAPRHARPPAGRRPPLTLTRRATDALDRARTEYADTIHPAGSLIVRSGCGDVRWWTWAGYRANAALSAVADTKQRPTHLRLRLRADLIREMWHAAIADATERPCLPDVDEKVLIGLKFSTALPRPSAEATLATRLADPDNASSVLTEPQHLQINQ